MAKVIAYRPPGFSQLQLDSGERILISCAQTGVRISKLGFFGLFPTKVIADWPISRIDEVIALFADPANPNDPPLDALMKKLGACATIDEVGQLCSKRAL